jgi:hypothetical protein
LSHLDIRILSTAEIVKELEVQRCLDHNIATQLEIELERRCGNLFAEPGLRDELEMLVGHVTVL